MQTVIAEIHTYIHTNTNAFKLLGLSDQLPSGYGSPCTWSCSQLASNGQCKYDWTVHKSNCFAGTTPPNGKVKDDCTLSCGKYHTLLLTLSRIIRIIFENSFKLMTIIFPICKFYRISIWRNNSADCSTNELSRYIY